MKSKKIAATGMMIGILIVLWGLSLSGFGLSVMPNSIIANGDFEAGTAGWTYQQHGTGNNGMFTTTGSDVYDGLASGILTCYSYESFNPGYEYLFVGQYFNEPLIPGESYTLFFSYRGYLATVGFYAWKDLGTSWDWIGGNTWYPDWSSGEWLSVSYEFIVPTEDSDIYAVRFQPHWEQPYTVTFSIDDVSVVQTSLIDQPTPTPTSFPSPSPSPTPTETPVPPFTPPPLPTPTPPPVVIEPTHQTWVLTIYSGYYGTTSPVGSFQYDLSQTAVVVAIPKDGYEFDYWSYNDRTRPDIIEIFTENPITVGPEEQYASYLLQAVFKESTRSTVTEVFNSYVVVGLSIFVLSAILYSKRKEP